jgi:hypothetical protein
MPKLEIFAPCEKVIEGIDGSISLINLFDKITIGLQALPQNAEEAISIPMRWSVFAKWIDVEGSGGKYEQMVRIIFPDGSDALHGSLHFEITERTIRTVMSIEGFPVSQEGDYRVVLSWRNTGSVQGNWEQIAESIVTVQYGGTAAIESA